MGSISHTDDMVGVAVALSKAYSGLGFDIALGVSVRPDLYRRILDDKELSQVKSNAVADVPTVIFSYTGSVFKAVIRQFLEPLDFQDTRMDISDGRFVAVCHRDGRFASVIPLGDCTAKIVVALSGHYSWSSQEFKSGINQFQPSIGPK